jgi:hypothetical protein
MDTLAFNHQVVALNVLKFKLSKASRIAFTLLASIIEHKHIYTKQTNKQTKNNTPIKRKALKECTKGYS